MNQFEDLDFPIIDAHVHLYPDALAEKVTPALGAKFGNTPAFDGTVNGCKQNARAAHICASLNLPVATEPRQVAHTNSFWRDYIPNNTLEKTSSDAHVFSLASYHPECVNGTDEIARIHAAGFTGIKFHPEYQKFHFNDKIMDDIWFAMSESNLVAFLHAGGERVFDPPYHSSPREIIELQKRFPRLKIVAAHLGGFHMWDEAEACMMGSNVYLDLSHTFFWMNDEQILRMIRKHGADHILFGTDAPWQEPRRVLDALLALPLSHEELRAICYTNAQTLFRL